MAGAGVGDRGLRRHRPAHRHRLLVDGQDIVDVPAKLSARARVFATGQGRKTDATDAHSVALVGTRMSGLRPVVADDQREVLRLLVDRRRSIGEEHTRKVNQLHCILLELIPGGAKRDLSAAQARKILADGAPARRRRQDAQAGRGRARRRPGADVRAQEGGGKELKTLVRRPAPP